MSENNSYCLYSQDKHHINLKAQVYNNIYWSWTVKSLH